MKILLAAGEVDHNLGLWCLWIYFSITFVRSCAGKSPLVLAQDKPDLLEAMNKQSEVVENGDHQELTCKKNNSKYLQKTAIIRLFLVLQSINIWYTCWKVKLLITHDTCWINDKMIHSTLLLL